MMKASLLFLGLILLAYSCISEELCEEDSISELVASFKTESGGVVSDTTISTKLSVYGIREGQDIWFLYDSVQDSEIFLPLDPHHDFSRFVFQTAEQIDTLTLTHSSQEYMISYSCGFGMQFTLEGIQYEEGMFVNDTIINPLINTSLEEGDTHIWLYF